MFDYLLIFVSTGIGVWCGYFICPKLEKWLVNLLSKWRNKK